MSNTYFFHNWYVSYSNTFAPVINKSKKIPVRLILLLVVFVLTKVLKLIQRNSFARNDRKRVLHKNRTHTETGPNSFHLFDNKENLRAICWPSVHPIFSKWFRLSYLCYFLDRKWIWCIFEGKKSEIFFWLFTCLSLHLLSVTSFLSILNSDLVRMFTGRQRRIPVQTFRLVFQKYTPNFGVFLVFSF